MRLQPTRIGSGQAEAGLPNLPLRLRLAARMRTVLRLFRPADDFDWSMYHVHYRSEVALSRERWTEDLAGLDFRIIDKRIYILADSKPLHPTHRCVYETLINLPAINSVAEIGTGGGRFIANLQRMLGPFVKYSAYDISARQLEFFAEQYPDQYQVTHSNVLDVTLQNIAETDRPDVVFASTVLMHIRRPDAYVQALRNLLSSAWKYAVLMDNYNSHDYFRDLTVRFGQYDYYCYDSGANVAIVADLTKLGLPSPYTRLVRSDQLARYISDYRWSSLNPGG
jgi:SAM-dependent methyltransferase